MDDANGLMGIRFLDHTADVGIDVEARTLPELFHRAALGMLALLRGEDDADPGPVVSSRSVESAPRPTGPSTPDAGTGEHTVSVSGQGRDRAAVLAAWLRELLFLHETGGLDYRWAEFARLEPSGFDATVRTEPARGAVREIKGVTYHELAVEETATGWKARVIFDV